MLWHGWPLAQAAAPPGYVPVVKVDDGDTIDVALDGHVERVRLLGIDTPETVDPRKPVQCFGKEASNRTKELLTGKVARLERDAGRGRSGDRDKYHRLLRYVYLPDGTMLNESLVRDGFAHEYTFQGQFYDHQASFKAAEQQAKSAGRGLWSVSTCRGDTTQPA